MSKEIGNNEIKEELKTNNERQKGRMAVEYARQMAWLLSLYRNEFLTKDEYDEGCRRLSLKYHQTPRV